MIAAAAPGLAQEEADLLRIPDLDLAAGRTGRVRERCGIAAIRPHRTACPRAVLSRRWCVCTVPAETVLLVPSRRRPRPRMTSRDPSAL